METVFRHCLYPIATGGRARSYWLWSEEVRLGLYDGSVSLLATDGSAGGTALGAGFVLRRGGAVTDWNGTVEGADEQVTSFRPEAAGLGQGMQEVPKDESVAVLVDNESVLTVIQAWIDCSHQPSPLAMADADMIQSRTAQSSFYKVKSHRGEPFNTRADALADRGVHNRNHVIQRSRPTRPWYQVQGYKWVWCAKVQRHAESTAARLYMELSSMRKGRMDAFLALKDMGRRYLGSWWRERSKLLDSDLKAAIQIVSDTYPTPANLKLWGMLREGKCDERKLLY
eukprot:2939040-Rhodomonas_salina.1